MTMLSLFLLIALAALLRLSGSVLRVDPAGWWTRSAGWLLCMAATFVATSAAGAWSPFWPILLFAMIGAAAEATIPTKQTILWISMDLAMVIVTGLLSIPPLGTGWVGGIAILITVLSFTIDYLLKHVRRSIRLLALAPGLLVLLLGLAAPDTAQSAISYLDNRLVHTWIVPPRMGVSPARALAPTPTLPPGDTPTPVPPGSTQMAPPPSVGSQSPDLSASRDDPADAPVGTPATGEASGSLDKNGTQWRYLEWSLDNPSYTGNPFDLVASATFVHQGSGESHTTEMFYAGGSTWKFRFTGTQPGAWTVTTASSDPELNGHSGTVQVAPNPGVPGFVVASGDKWVRTGTNEAFVPQYVMYGGPQVYHNDPGQISADIQTFMVGHGFTGFHTPVYCRWFDINQQTCNDINQSDPNPDVRTFEALEQLIAQVHEQGGVVHIWMWGDDSRGENPKRWGLNGPQDQRLQRYIAARLGPLPGWTMGYGYDLHEWVNGTQLTVWHDYMQEHFGWPHLLGARGPKNEIDQISEDMDYSSYEQHKPSYETYVQTIEDRAHKPSFSEDRFRMRNEGRPKDYTMEETRRGLWHSAMAGGVANIWGNLLGPGACANTGDCASAPYPEPDWIKTYATFFDGRFTADLVRCNPLTDGVCLRRPSEPLLLFYKEDASTVLLDLSSLASGQPAIAVDTLRPYQEINLGVLEAATQTWQAPYPSDWAIAVGAAGAPPPPPPGPSPTPQPTATPGEPGGSADIAINFQPASAQAPSGYLVDDGSRFGARGSGLRYGWSTDNRANARERNSPNAPDQRYDTLNHFQEGEGSIWEIALPPGNYQVRVVLGDPDYEDQLNHILVEGERWQDADGRDAFDDTGTMMVAVADGRLTVQAAPNADNAKINFIEIDEAASTAYYLPIIHQ